MSLLDGTFIACTPFTDQKPGTAGLRKKVAEFRKPHYLEMFVQAVLDTLALPKGARIVLGGDGRYFNREAMQTILGLFAANGLRHVIVGVDGLMSTPAASHIIRERRAAAGFILTASHNPGGPDGDFGLKFNMSTGGQAPEAVTDEVYRRSRELEGYRTVSLPQVDLGKPGTQQIEDLLIEVIDSTRPYATLMQTLFDFDAMRSWLGSGHHIRFDAMYGVTGLYAQHIFVDLLGAPPESLLRADPRPDFGGGHPDPNPLEAASLVAESRGANAPDLLAASDGDGDRNMILGPGFFLSPGDSVAMMLDSIRMIPGYRDGVPGAARSMPTSRALDVVAERHGVACYETPTGWRFFCNLLEAGLIGLCGEESFGTGSDHVREKDGIWAVLFWLNRLAAGNKSLPDIAHEHWSRYGRHHFQRWDYITPDGAAAAALMENLRSRLGTLANKSAGGARIVLADDFHYHDPVDGSESAHQGVRLAFDDGARIVLRLSGTGTTGATLRMYLERHVKDAGSIRADTATLLAPLGALAGDIARIEHHTNLKAPTDRI